MARAIESGKKTKLHYESLTKVACGTKCPCTGGHHLRITKNAWMFFAPLNGKMGSRRKVGESCTGDLPGQNTTLARCVKEGRYQPRWSLSAPKSRSYDAIKELTMYCPKTASSFCAEPISDEVAADWCKRQHRRSAQVCQSCQLGVEYGVVEAVKEKAVVKVEQGRLFR